MQIKNEKLRRFLRRYGGLCILGLAAAAIITVAVIGRSSDVNLFDRYLPSVPEETFPNYSEEELWDEVFEVDKLGLKYEAHFKGLDGENFYYTVEFDRPLPDDIEAQVWEQIEKKCGKATEDNYYGCIVISRSKNSDSELDIYLDLGSSNDTKAITGILRALNEIEGVKSVLVNDWETYSGEA